MRMDLRTARVAAKMTQKDVAEKLGVTQASICHWERGTRMPKVASFFRLCDLYGISPSDVFMPFMQGQT